MRHKYILLLIPVVLLCFISCKKDAASTQPKVTIIGKWYLTKHNLKLISGGVQVGASSKSDYTKYDFTQYFEDGTGLFSTKADSTALVGINTFRYTLTGTSLTQYANGSAGVVETITKLTETEFSIHYETIIRDPYDPDQIDNEIDDFDFKRSI